MSETDLMEVLDSDLKEAFKDLQDKKVQVQKQTNEMDTQIGQLMKLAAHADLTYKEIVAMPPSTNVYNSLGRMFVLSNFEQVKANINKEFEYVTTRIINFENSKQYLELLMKEKANDLRTMLKRRKDILESQQSQVGSSDSGAIPDSVSDAVSNLINDPVSVAVPNVVPVAVPDAIPVAAPEAVPVVVADAVPVPVADAVPVAVSDAVPVAVPDAIPVADPDAVSVAVTAEP